MNGGDIALTMLLSFLSCFYLKKERQPVNLSFNSSETVSAKYVKRYLTLKNRVEQDR